MSPTLSSIPATTRASLADQLDTVVRELQVLQGVLRATDPTMPLATASTGLIGAMITTREVSDAVGMAEAEVLSATMIHEAPGHYHDPSGRYDYCTTDHSFEGPSL